MSIELNIQGEKLAPQAVTEKLGMAPDKAYAKGDSWFTHAGLQRERHIGIWKWGITVDKADADLNSITNSFCQSLAPVVNQLKKVPGIDRAWVDFYICKELAENESSDVQIGFTVDSLIGLRDLGLPVEITTGVVGYS